MSRTWITGLTIAGIAGTGGAAAFAGMSSEQPATEPTSTDASTPSAGTTDDHGQASEHVTYQIGTIGTVTLEVEGDRLEIEGTTVTTGWGLVATSVPGTHVGAQFTDGTQLVTFSADLVNGEVVVNVTNQAAEGVVTTDPLSEVTVSVVPGGGNDGGHGGGHDDGTVPPPGSATPPPTNGTTAPTTPPPAPSTSAPSSHEDEDDDDDDEDEDHGEDEDDDHEEEDDD